MNGLTKEQLQQRVKQLEALCEAQQKANDALHSRLSQFEPEADSSVRLDIIRKIPTGALPQLVRTWEQVNSPGQTGEES